MHPLLVKHGTLPLHERLKGRPTLRWLPRLEVTQWLPLGQLRDYQFRRLHQHLTFAYQRVPYYRSVLDAHGLHPSRIQSFDDFAKIPSLTRETVREHFQALCARPQPPRTQRLSTSGSNGVPVTVLVDTERMGFGEAARLRSHRWFGIEPGAREVVLWGAPAELDRQDFVRRVRDWLINSRLLSAFDFSEMTLERYGGIITRLRPRKMFGYATALYLLACYLEARGWQPPGDLRAVFTTAEPLFDFQRRKIEKVFGCPAATEYGSRDGGLAANECPAGGLHIPAEGMHVEIQGNRGDGVGEILLTSFDSLAFPIIRYRVGDLGALDDTPCRCGRTLPRLRSVEGRQTDFVVTPDGRCLHALSLIYPLREHPRVREFQIVQPTIDTVRVLIVPEPGFSSDDEHVLRSRLATRLGPEIAIEIDRVPQIERSAAGKFRYVISHVAQAHIEGLLAKAQA